MAEDTTPSGAPPAEPPEIPAEPPEVPAEPPQIVVPPRNDRARSRRNVLHVALAWVGIVAGAAFVVAVVYFSGFIVGRGAEEWAGWHPSGPGDVRGPGAPVAGCPMMGPDRDDMSPHHDGDGPYWGPMSPGEWPPPR